MPHRIKALNPKLAATIGAVVVALVGVVLLHLNSRLGLSLRFASYDWAYDFLFIKQRPATADEITIIYLDEASYIDFQQPFNRPWDRSIHARLLDRLTADGARAVIFDVVFSDPGPSPEVDRAFADAIRRNGRVILAADYSDNQAPVTQGARTRETTLTLPDPLFAEAAAGWGLAQLQPDEDFLVREHNHGPRETDYVSLTWAAARLLKLPVAATDAARFDERWVNYYGGPDNFQGFSYKLAFDKPAGYYRDKIVLVGGRPQTGLLRERKDQFRSPYTTWYTNPVFVPAVDVHATTLLNLIRQDWLHRLPPSAELALVLLGALVFGAGLMRFRPQTAAIVAALGALGLAVAALLAFGFARVWFPWLVIVAAQAPVGLLGVICFKSIEWYAVRRALERQREQAQLQIREQAALLDKAQDAIMVHNLDWHSTYWNPSAERLYGWTAAEAREHSILDLLYKGDGEKFAAARDAVLSKGEWSGQLRHTTKAGKEVLVESRWTRVGDAAGQPNAVLVLNTDITERSQLESQLLRTQRLESIGTLAGGIAHDLNNVLSPILMGVEMLEAREADERKKKTLQIIRTSAERGAGMVKQVLVFARGQEGEKVTLQLKHAIHEMEKIARETFPKSIEVRAKVVSDLRPIQGDATQLHQVLLNLCVNARDAMPEGGRIFIEAENVSLDEATAKPMLGARPGDYVRLRVQDTGTGMPQKIIDRIFEPFFTTKGVGKGTGLGLSTVLSIVKNHGGLMDVASVVGKGTTFTILFPPADPAADVQPSVNDQLDVSGKGRLVLVVDDEPLIRDTLGTVLTENDYRVLQAEDGARGLELFIQHGADISIVIIDMMMPVLDGRKAMGAMLQIRPDTKFIAITGLMNPSDIAQGSHAAQIEVLRKPFGPATILELVARLTR